MKKLIAITCMVILTLSCNSEKNKWVGEMKQMGPVTSRDNIYAVELSDHVWYGVSFSKHTPQMIMLYFSEENFNSIADIAHDIADSLRLNGIEYDVKNDSNKLTFIYLDVLYFPHIHYYKETNNI